MHILFLFLYKYIDFYFSLYISILLNTYIFNNISFIQMMFLESYRAVKLNKYKKKKKIIILHFFLVWQYSTAKFEKKENMIL